MPRPRRVDAPGLLHHVMNRGLARRTVFETRRDVRYFLALLAVEARAGRIEILAYAILTTHFHLLVRSQTGQLGRVMQRVVNRYVRYFNRSRRRDGPLFRGRFRSKPVRSVHYRHVLVRYIDQNSAQARLTANATLYPYGSACHYVAERRPPWLATRWADAAMESPPPSQRAAAYARVFGRRLLPHEARLVEQRLAHGPATADDWDDLIGCAPARVLDWMRRKARLADGTKPGLPYVDAARVVRLVRDEQRRQGEMVCRTPGRRRRDAWPVLRMGLLRDLSGLTHAEISRREMCSPNMAARRVGQHAGLLEEDSGYARRVSEIAAQCLEDH